MKVKKVFLIFFILIFFLSFAFALKRFALPSTSLFEAFLSDGQNETYLLKLSKISQGTLNVIFESEDKNELLKIKSDFELKTGDFIANDEFSDEFIELLNKYPKNFLSDETRYLLKNKNYDLIEQKSLNLLYDPMGAYVAPLDKDPYLFLTDYVTAQLPPSEDEIIKKGEKFYSLLTFNNLTFDDVKKIKTVSDEFNKSSPAKIYLSGTPAHTLEMSEISKLQINIICILSFLFLVLLFKLSLNSFKILLPVILSIAFGYLFGFIFCVLIFQKIHVLTLVFATSLIGLGMDYSLHYYLSDDEKKFKKSLLISFLSSALAFLTFYFSNIAILKQISVFVAFGLLGIYSFVMLILPCFDFKFDYKKRFIPISFKKYDKIFISALSVMILFGFWNLRFDDNVKNLYEPKNELLKAQMLEKTLFNKDFSGFVLVRGGNLNEILKNEEKICAKLHLQNTKFRALSNFIPSIEKQKENIALINELYQKNLNKYAFFLNKNAKKSLILKNEIFNPDEISFKNNFLLDNNTSFVILLSEPSGFEVYKPADEISKILKSTRKHCSMFLPLVFSVLILALRLFLKNFKSALYITAPSFFGGLIALFLALTVYRGLNIFHILAFVLSIGFGLDYSIFRRYGDKNSSFAVLISCISTVFSFVLLSFSAFKPISSLGFVLSTGILASYILSLSFLESDDTQNM